MEDGVCVRHAYASAVFTCSLPSCNATRHKPTLMVQAGGTGGDRAAWTAYLQFELGRLGKTAGRRLVDAELQLVGTRRCYHRASSRAGVNFTHRLHLLRGPDLPARGTVPPDGSELLAQWSHLVYDGRFRLPLAIRPLAGLGVRPRRSVSLLITDATGAHASGAGAFSFDAAAAAGPAMPFDVPLAEASTTFERRFDAARTERPAGGRAVASTRRLRDTCSYYSDTRPEMDDRPVLRLTYAWRCCATGTPVGGRAERAGDGRRAGRVGPEDGVGRETDTAVQLDGGSGGSGGGGGGGSDGLKAGPAWMSEADWRAASRWAPPAVTWHSRLAATPPSWVGDATADATSRRCTGEPPPGGGVGGQRAPPSGEAPSVSIIISYHNGEPLTAACVRALFACASELPSAEWLLVDDGSTNSTGELPPLLARLAREHGIRYELARYPTAVGFTLATSEAARRANGSLLLFVNNDAFVTPRALAAMLATMETHSDVGVVGAKLVGDGGVVQEAGAVAWSDGSGAWFRKASQLRAGRLDEATNVDLNYARETDYVSAAFALVRRAEFVRRRMFDFHYSPGYYEDTDLCFTLRHAAGLRSVYQPLALVHHQSHSTFGAEVEERVARNRRHFVGKWAAELSEHMPSCVAAAACRPPMKRLYTHLAATRLYAYRVLWVDMILPEADRDSGSVRTLTMLKILLAMRCHVTIASVQRSGAGRHARYTRLLQFLGVRVMPSLGHLASHPSARDPYDLIIVARRDAYAAAAPLLSRAYPTTPVAFDTVDLHFAREAQRRAFFTAHADEPELLAAVFGPAAAGAANDTGGAGAAERAAMRRRELRAAAGSTAAVVVSERERGALLHELRGAGYAAPPVVVIANAHEPAPLTPAPFGERSGVVFVGNFNHLPNRDAVLFFANHVLPLILSDPRAARDPGLVFHVVGSNRIPAAILQLNSTADRGAAAAAPRIVVHGYVDDLRPLYGRMRLSVAPLRWGAGVKGKVNTAHQLGVPVVCTAVAADGMHAVHGRDVLIADGAGAFARQTLAAYYNASLWRRLQAGGRRLLARRFSASRAAAGLLELLARLRNASVPLASKTLGIQSPRHRAYVDLRAAAALGGYYFNFTRLDDQLAVSNDRVDGEAAACTAAGGQQRAARVRAAPGSTYFLSVVGSHSGSAAVAAAGPAAPSGEAEGSYDANVADGVGES